MPEVVRKFGGTEQTYYRWKREYDGLPMDQARRMKNLEREKARLKRLLADAELPSEGCLGPAGGSGSTGGGWTTTAGGRMAASRG